MRPDILFVCMWVSMATVVHGAEPVDRLGSPLTPAVELVAIEAILIEPEAWVGRTVRIEGDVAGVCAMQGCWIDLTSDTDKTLRVKVDDGVIVFPADSVGRRAVAEGTVEIVELERERYEAWLRHVAAEEGREFDPAEVGNGPYRIVRLRGSGAEISAP